MQIFSLFQFFSHIIIEIFRNNKMTKIIFKHTLMKVKRYYKDTKFVALFSQLFLVWSTVILISSVERNGIDHNHT